MDSSAPRTADDLHAIARFIRERVSDEYKAAGRLDYYLEEGATIQAQIPSTYGPPRDVAQEFTDNWLNAHGAEQFLSMASALASLAEELCNVLRLDVNKPGGDFRVKMAWPELVRTAKLWGDHADFQAAWEQGERGRQSG